MKGPPVGSTGYIENVGEAFIKAAGEWFLDETKREIFYALHADEDAATLDAVLPVLETLIEGKQAKHLKFKDLTFEHATWARPGGNDGYVEIQSGVCMVGQNSSATVVKSPANIAFKDATGIEFHRVKFHHLGGNCRSDCSHASATSSRRIISLGPD